MANKVSVFPGARFGRLTVIKRLPDRRVLCKCDCGKETVAYANNLPRGNTRSCGCLREEMRASGEMNAKHGLFHRYRSEHRIWGLMKDRCYNPKSNIFRYYGGRGIKVCERWRNDFAAFLNDIGPRPSLKHSIDRIDNDGNYEPGNVRWATRIEQARNCRPRGTAVV